MSVGGILLLIVAVYVIAAFATLYLIGRFGHLVPHELEFGLAGYLDEEPKKLQVRAAAWSTFWPVLLVSIIFTFIVIICIAIPLGKIGNFIWRQATGAPAKPASESEGTGA